MTKPLFADMQDDCEAEFSAAMTYLSQTFGTEYAERFSEGVAQVLRERCETVAQDIAEHGRTFDRTHDEASLRFSRPVYRANVLLSRRRARRSSSGLWYVFYALKTGRASENLIRSLCFRCDTACHSHSG